ncbi:MAG: hypothetical protein ACIAXF_08270 [Phycisphaerales bacterium JB063]
MNEEDDLLFVPPLVLRPMNLSSLKPGGFRRALNGAGMIWLTGLWVGFIVLAVVRPSPPAPQMPPAWAMAALCGPLALWQLFGLWRICSLRTGNDRKRTLSAKDAMQSVLLGLFGPPVLFGAVALLVLVVSRL